MCEIWGIGMLVVKGIERERIPRRVCRGDGGRLITHHGELGAGHELLDCLVPLVSVEGVDVGGERWAVWMEVGGGRGR